MLGQGSRRGETAVPDRQESASVVPRRYAKNPRAAATRSVSYESGQTSHPHLSETCSQTGQTMQPSYSGLKPLYHTCTCLKLNYYKYSLIRSALQVSST